MDVMKKKFLSDVRNSLKSMGMPNDKIEQIVSEIEVRYNIESERGKSHSEIVKNQFGSHYDVSQKYGKIFGYSRKGSQKTSNKKFLNRDSNMSGSLKNGYNYVRKLNKQTPSKNKVTKNSKGLSDTVDSAIMNFIEMLISD